MDHISFTNGATKLTPAHRAAMQRFTSERRQSQCSTEPVDETAAEELLCGAYEEVKLPPPAHILWVDGPLELIALLGEKSKWFSIDDEYREHISGWAWEVVRNNAEIASLEFNDYHSGIDRRIRDVRLKVRSDLANQVTRNLAYDEVQRPLDAWMDDNTARPLLRALVSDARWPFGVHRRYQEEVEAYIVWYGAAAFVDAADLAYSRFFDEYVAMTPACCLAHFNELVSGYWCGATIAIIVRKPKYAARDAEGRLHSTTGRCMEYRDGWGFCAWHGTWVPDWLIAKADKLTRDDFFGAGNIEVRRVIQEMMGQQFIWEIGARYLDSGARGVLYEVDLPNDPERVARYVQVSDASTNRVYYLRVPPTTATAAEAVAWTFGLGVNDYEPLQET